ncbi:MAG TPA: hypothetical protein VKE27_11430 [Candidatus Dormibacteraeota bacterium]|nr:hypothetical protein [Candidatus Dormibacteraeota bacterium]
MSATRKARKAGSDTAVRAAAALDHLFEAIAPWLFELGNWIFGGLIAFNLIILGALLTVGPVDAAVKISMAAFALALPLDLAGFLILRLFADMLKVSFGDLGIKAFTEAGFSYEGAETPHIADTKVRRVAVRYSYSLLSVTSVLTVIGLTAALWHMAWWIGVIFAVTVVASQFVVVAAVSTIGPVGRWRTAAGEVEPPRGDQAG